MYVRASVRDNKTREECHSGKSLHAYAHVVCQANSHVHAMYSHDQLLRDARCTIQFFVHAYANEYELVYMHLYMHVELHVETPHQ